MFLPSFLEPLWLVLVLVLTGGGCVGFGVRNQHRALRVSGVVLQLLSLYIFSSLVWYPLSGSIGRNYYFLSCLFMAVTAFSSAFVIEKCLIGRVCLPDRICFWLLFVLGVFAWYVGAIREVYAHITLFERLSGILLVVSVTSILVGIISENIEWESLNVLLLLQLPAMVGILLYHNFTEGNRFSMLTGWGATVWPITFFIQYRALAVIDDCYSKAIRRVYHLTSLWLLFYFCNLEIGFALKKVQTANSTVIMTAQPLFTLTCIFVLLALQRTNVWPVRLYPRAYVWAGSLGIIVISVFSSFL